MMHPPFDAVLAWSTAVLVLLCSFASVSQADVRFTEPPAGANLTAGQIDVRWEDSGIKPPISELTQYTLSLMVGGNDNQDMVCIFVDDLSLVRLRSSHLLSATCVDVSVRGNFHGRGHCSWHHTRGHCCRCTEWLVSIQRHARTTIEALLTSHVLASSE